MTDHARRIPQTTEEKNASSLVKQIVSITKVTEDEALFALHDSNFDLAIALDLLMSKTDDSTVVHKKGKKKTKSGSKEESSPPETTKEEPQNTSNVPSNNSKSRKKPGGNTGPKASSSQPIAITEVRPLMEIETGSWGHTDSKGTHFPITNGEIGSFNHTPPGNSSRGRSGSRGGGPIGGSRRPPRQNSSSKPGASEPPRQENGSVSNEGNAASFGGFFVGTFDANSVDNKADDFAMGRNGDHRGARFATRGRGGARSGQRGNGRPNMSKNDPWPNEESWDFKNDGDWRGLEFTPSQPTEAPSEDKEAAVTSEPPVTQPQITSQPSESSSKDTNQTSDGENLLLKLLGQQSLDDQLSSGSSLPSSAPIEPFTSQKPLASTSRSQLQENSREPEVPDAPPGFSQPSSIAASELEFGERPGGITNVVAPTNRRVPNSNVSVELPSPVSNFEIGLPVNFGEIDSTYLAQSNARMNHARSPNLNFGVHQAQASEPQQLPSTSAHNGAVPAGTNLINEMFPKNSYPKLSPDTRSASNYPSSVPTSLSAVISSAPVPVANQASSPSPHTTPLSSGSVNGPAGYLNGQTQKSSLESGKQQTEPSSTSIIPSTRGTSQPGAGGPGPGPRSVQGSSLYSTDHTSTRSNIASSDQLRSAGSTYFSSPPSSDTSAMFGHSGLERSPAAPAPPITSQSNFASARPAAPPSTNSVSHSLNEKGSSGGIQQIASVSNASGAGTSNQQQSPQLAQAAFQFNSMQLGYLPAGADATNMLGGRGVGDSGSSGNRFSGGGMNGAIGAGAGGGAGIGALSSNVNSGTDPSQFQIHPAAAAIAAMTSIGGVVGAGAASSSPSHNVQNQSKNASFVDSSLTGTASGHSLYSMNLGNSNLHQDLARMTATGVGQRGAPGRPEDSSSPSSANAAAAAALQPFFLAPVNPTYPTNFAATGGANQIYPALLTSPAAAAMFASYNPLTLLGMQQQTSAAAAAAGASSTQGGVGGSGPGSNKSQQHLTSNSPFGQQASNSYAGLQHGGTDFLHSGSSGSGSDYGAGKYSQPVGPAYMSTRVTNPSSGNSNPKSSLYGASNTSDYHGMYSKGGDKMAAAAAAALGGGGPAGLGTTSPPQNAAHAAMFGSYVQQAGPGHYAGPGGAPGAGSGTAASNQMFSQPFLHPVAAGLLHQSQDHLRGPPGLGMKTGANAAAAAGSNPSAAKLGGASHAAQLGQHSIYGTPAVASNYWQS